jgi:sugar phosphate isomerase/epimerase
MPITVDRRAFLGTALGGLAMVDALPHCARAEALPHVIPAGRPEGRRHEHTEQGIAARPSRIKLSCNLYSFNAALTSGEMSLEQVIDFCAGLGFDAVDPTGYYFRGYPAPAADEEIYRVKHRAFRSGLDISGTGVRNNFVLADRSAREAEVAHVTRWIDVAAKLGAPVLRVFSGLEVPQGHTIAEAREWVVACVTTVTERAAARGVMIVLQNHDDFVKTADDVLEIRRRVPSEWFGLNVDVGSLRMGDPYADIARLAPYAYTWQLKERLYRENVEEATDVGAVLRIMRETGYRGYVPLETLGAGDAREKVRLFLGGVRAALARMQDTG